MSDPGTHSQEKIRKKNMFLLLFGFFINPNSQKFSFHTLLESRRGITILSLTIEYLKPQNYLQDLFFRLIKKNKKLNQMKLLLKKKLDGIGPLDNRPSSSTDKLCHFLKRRRKKTMWQVTGDALQVTRDTWQVTCDLWYMTRARWGRWPFSQNFSSPAHTLWEWRCF